jgi:hypothetical protein
MYILRYVQKNYDLPYKRYDKISFVFVFLFLFLFFVLLVTRKHIP